MKKIFKENLPKCITNSLEFLKMLYLLLKFSQYRPEKILFNSRLKRQIVSKKVKLQPWELLHSSKTFASTQGYRYLFKIGTMRSACAEKSFLFQVLFFLLDGGRKSKMHTWTPFLILSAKGRVQNAPVDIIPYTFLGP